MGKDDTAIMVGVKNLTIKSLLNLLTQRLELSQEGKGSSN
jgi:hypothetical protein